MAKKKNDPTLDSIKEAPARGRVGVIGKEEIEKAYETFLLYKKGKTVLEQRVVENEQWYKQRHWELVGKGRTPEERAAHADDPEPTSAWLFNSLANKHADFMDNYPMPNILPKEKGDVQEAQRLSSIIPAVLDSNKFKRTYSKNCWPKEKHGTAVYAVLWNNQKMNGLGDIDIKKVDILNVYWEPGVSDIQQSRNFFHTESVDNDVLLSLWPFLEGKLGSSGTKDQAVYQTEDEIDDTNKTTVFDWYYKKREGSATKLHYCKFIEGEIIYASENDTEPKGHDYIIDPVTNQEVAVPRPSMAQTGWYAHGLYPFEFDVMFPIEGSPCGFGYVDLTKEPQLYIDKMNQIILKNALMSGKKRWFAKKGLGINIKDFADWSKDIVETEGMISDENLREFQVSPLPPFIANYMEMKIDELKETSGNRDFSQGGTSAGVTAASAIAALQEAGSKLSRDMISTSYDSFENINYLVLELIREFYSEERSFRITGDDGRDEFTTYDNTNIRERVSIDPMTGEEEYSKPIFDIKVVAQKKSPFNRIAQNELAKELFGAGLFNPQIADQALIVLDMMEFEGKDAVREKVQKNAQMFAMIQQLQEALVGASVMADPAGVTGMTEQYVAQGLIPEEHPLVQKAREAAANITTPGGNE